MVRQLNILQWTEWPQMTLKQQMGQWYIKYLTHMPTFLSTAHYVQFMFLKQNLNLKILTINVCVECHREPL